MQIETNAKDLVREIDAFAGKLFPGVLDEVEEFATDTERGAKSLAPKGRTGNLAAAVTSEVVKTSNRIVASFGWDKKGFYGKFFEYGTKKIAARPHIRPSFDRNVPRLMRRIDGMIARWWSK